MAGPLISASEEPPRPENITGAESRPCTATAAPAYGRFQQADGAFAEIGSVAGLGAGGAGIRSRADADRDLVPEGGGLVLLVEEGKAEHVEAFQTASRRARSSLSAATARLVTTVRPTRSTVTADGLPCPDIRAWEADWPMISSLCRGRSFAHHRPLMFEARGLKPCGCGPRSAQEGTVLARWTTPASASTRSGAYP